MKFEKYHALGNDYLVYDPLGTDHPFPANEIIRICHRNFGLGSDGILVGPLETEKADFGLRILNPMGAKPKKVVMAYEFLQDISTIKKVSTSSFTVDTLGGIVTCEVTADASSISVEMGQVSFRSDIIPVAVEGEAREILNEEITVNGETYKYYAGTIGNPHCVVPLPEISEELARKLGPELENHPLFPNRTNVQLLQVLDRNRIRIEIWERGAGYTLASGSSSSAAGAVARKMGAADENITVEMPGGEIGLVIDDKFNVKMTDLPHV